MLEKVVSLDDGDARAAFKTTKLDKAEEGTEKKIDDLRTLFNKMTSKTYDGQQDKIKSLLKKRGMGISSDVYDSVVPQFLSEMDGLNNNENIATPVMVHYCHWPLLRHHW